MPLLLHSCPYSARQPEGKAGSLLGSGSVFCFRCTGSCDIIPGKHGHRMSVEFSPKTAPSSMFGLPVDTNGQFSFIGAEAQNEWGPLPQMGNSMTRDGRK